MDSKEEQVHHVAEASTGSSSSSSSSLSTSSDDDTENTDLGDTGGNKGVSGDNSKGRVSDDDEGGYASGKEEFESALENPVVSSSDDGNVGRVVEEGNFDDSFVDASGVYADSGVLASDYDVGKGNKDVGRIADKDKVGFGSGSERKVFEEAEEVTAAAAEESRVVGPGDVRLTPEGDSVVDTIVVDVASPGVAIVREMEERNDDKTEVSVDEGVFGSVIEGKVFDEVDPEKEEFEGRGKIESSNKKDVGDALETEDVVAAAAPEDSKEVGPGGVKLTPEGDSVVDTIMVDVTSPGVATVREREERKDEKTEVSVDEQVGGSGGEGKVFDEVDADKEGFEERGKIESLNKKDAGDALEIEDVAVAAAPEDSKEVGPGGVKLTPEGDSIVDAMQVDVGGPGVAIVGEREERGLEKKEKVLVPGELICGTNENGGDASSSREVGVNDLISERSAEITNDASDKKALQPENAPTLVGEKEELTKSDDTELMNELQSGKSTLDSVDGGRTLGIESYVKKQGEEFEPTNASETTEKGVTSKIDSNRYAVLSDEAVGTEKNVIQPRNVSAETEQINGEQDANVHAHDDKLENRVSEKFKLANSGESKAALEPQEITELEDEDRNELDEEIELVETLSEGDTEGLIFGNSEDARKFITDLEQGSGAGSQASADSSFEQSRRIDGQVVTDSEEEADSDDEGDGKGLFDSAALAALLKAATGAESDTGSITITSQDGSRLFSVERPAGLGSSLRSLRPASSSAARPNQPNRFGPTVASGGDSEDNMNEEEKTKLEKLQKMRVKFLRLVHRLGVSPEESVAAQVLYRLALLGGRQGTQTYSLDAAKRLALQLEEDEKDALDFSINILVLGKSGLGKSATINSIFEEEKSMVDAFETGTPSVKKISGSVDGVKIHVVDTPGLKSSAMEQGFNRSVLSAVKNFTKKSPPDVVLYVDRLDAQTRDLNDLPLLRTITSSLGSTIWRSAVVTLTHAASAPPDGPSGTPLSYEVFVTQRSHVVQQSIGHAVGDLRMMSPSLMNPVSLVENHLSCRKNREGQKILPNGQSWKPQLLLLCYSMKILSEASSLSKPQDTFDHRKIFGFRARAPPLPYMLSSMLQSRAHPKLPSDQGGDNVDSDIDLDDFSDSDREEEDEYDQLPPFKPLRKAQLSKLSKEQRRAYFEEYDYRVKLLQKKQWKDELRRMREIKKNGKVAGNDFGVAEDDVDPGTAAPVSVPLPDMALPPSFDGDNPSHRYRFLEPTSQFLARPVLDNHGWDHDCGYDGVNVEHSLAIASQFPGVYTIQITKDKKDFSVSLDSSIAAKHGENMSTMLGFDIQSMGKQLAYIIRGETKLNKLKKNKAAGGISVTFLGDNVVPGLKIENQINFGRQYVLVGGAGAVRSQHDIAYGANFELQRRELDYPVGQVQSTFSMSVIKWKGDLALGFNTLAQFSVGRNSKVAVRAGINNKLSGQVTVKTSSSEHLSLALAAIIPTIFRKLWSRSSEKHSIY